MRSLLFAPGDQPSKLAKALSYDADAVIADLEDAVTGPEKVAARRTIEEAFGAAAPDGPARLVRVNALDTPWAEDDLAWVRGLGPAAILLPKATPDAVARLPADLPPVIAIVETAVGVLRAFDVAAHPAVHGLLLGALDLSAEIGFRWTAEGTALLHARSKVVLESAAAGVAPPLDTAWLRLTDDAGLATEARHAHELGFRGKCCVHPRQVPVVNEAFSAADDQTWAQAVVAAYADAAASGDGVFALDGEMVDTASLRRARRILGADREPS